MEEDSNIVVFSDDDGNEFEMEIIDRFEHKGQEYAVLSEVEPEECKNCENDCEDCDMEFELRVMKIVVNGDMEEFVPVDDDEIDEVLETWDKTLPEYEGDS